MEDSVLTRQVTSAHSNSQPSKNQGNTERQRHAAGFLIGRLGLRYLIIKLLPGARSDVVDARALKFLGCSLLPPGNHFP